MVLKLEKPLAAGLLRVIAAVQAAAEEEGVEPLLVGATARDLLLVHVFGQRVRRATKDVDFAVALDSWEAFERLKNRLIHAHGFVDTPQQLQRLTFTAPGEGEGTSMDLVPFGGMQVDKSTLVWPPEMDVYMTVAGFPEALETALVVELSPDQQVKVASLPALAILKLFAWGDRRFRGNDKDAVDFYTLLRSYCDAGTSDRMADPDQALDRYMKLGCDDERTGAWLLGVDCGSIIGDDTIENLNKLLSEVGVEEKLLTAMTSQDRGIKDARERAESLWRLFLEGLEGSLQQRACEAP